MPPSRSRGWLRHPGFVPRRAGAPGGPKRSSHALHLTSVKLYDGYCNSARQYYEDATDTVETLEHVAGALCLELANSVPNRKMSTGRDWLLDPGIEAWAASVGLPDVDGDADPVQVATLRELRETVHRVFVALADGDQPPPADLDALTQLYARGLAEFGYAVDDGLVRRRWPDDASHADRLARLASSAIELLTSPHLGRVRGCPSCGWLFVDSSRNQSRRWCSMQTCGNRTKARRHHARQSSPQPGGQPYRS